MTAKAYYWNDGPRNFGDLLTPYILGHFANTEVMWSSPKDADIVCAGSVIDVLPDGWSGIVAGAGKLHEFKTPDMRNACVTAVRGAGTMLDLASTGAYPSDGVDRKVPILGDPGLLASELVKAERNRYKLGIVPHWIDTSLWNRYRHIRGRSALSTSPAPAGSSSKRSVVVSAGCPLACMASLWLTAQVWVGAQELSALI